MHREDPQLRHIDRAWASTVHAFQGRTVDRVIAAMEAGHAHLTTQKTFYVEISRARHHAELVTDDRNALREHLEAATGERIAALEAILPERGYEADMEVNKAAERDPGPLPPGSRVPERHGEPERTRAPVERTPETTFPVPQPEKRPRERERVIEGAGARTRTVARLRRSHRAAAAGHAVPCRENRRSVHLPLGPAVLRSPAAHDVTRQIEYPVVSSRCTFRIAGSGDPVRLPLIPVRSVTPALLETKCRIAASEALSDPRTMRVVR